MGFVTVYEKPHSQYFKANPVSLAFFVQLVLFVITIGVPIVLVAVNPDSWPLYTTDYEQPRVQYQQIALVNLQLGNGDSLTWSTLPALNSLQQQTYRAAILKTKEEDDNGDRIPERLLISLDMPLQPNEQVFGITFLIFLTLGLQKRTDFEMATIANVHHSAISPGVTFFADASVRLNQRVPITQGIIDKTLLVPALDFSSNDIEDYSIPVLLRTVGKTNVSVGIDPVQSVWISGAGSGSGFRAEISLSFPVTPIWFSTTILHRLSTAGSFYVFWLLPFWLAACLFARYLFSYGLIPTIRHPEKYTMKAYSTTERSHQL
ncbi:transmembrane protein 231-like [Paramacrobiotus metropolitanus]|uniref:transmembrane protein 231-like n=1 Tax=Paramacrobiotus metropolitanus TaxID=2943436 RepID=UPI0024456469|nr:transmembrane protein 231-like [Paramacrobiotus metropolitanus]